jgi:hypothetical protein
MSEAPAQSVPKGRPGASGLQGRLAPSAPLV